MSHRKKVNIINYLIVDVSMMLLLKLDFCAIIKFSIELIKKPKKDIEKCDRIGNTLKIQKK